METDTPIEEAEGISIPVPVYVQPANHAGVTGEEEVQTEMGDEQGAAEKGEEVEAEMGEEAEAEMGEEVEAQTGEENVTEIVEEEVTEIGEEEVTEIGEEEVTEIGEEEDETEVNEQNGEVYGEDEEYEEIIDVKPVISVKEEAIIVRSSLIEEDESIIASGDMEEYVEMSGQSSTQLENGLISGVEESSLYDESSEFTTPSGTIRQAQTITIVPSDNGNGEISYVVIVSEPTDDTDADKSVYDFNEVVEVAKKQMQMAPQSQSATKIHMCQFCSFTTNKRYLLHRHMKSHVKQTPHRCEVCDRTFRTHTSLHNHLNTHAGVRPHHCPNADCDCAFTTSGELVRHIRYKHTKEKPHKCTECDYASVELSKLRRHMRCHTGERPYQCPHCTYASPDNFKLKRHLRVHTGEKPYVCDVCSARFTQSNSLKSHRITHSGVKPQYQCELCPASCSRKTDLRIHVMKLHTSDRPLECRKCGQFFPDRYTFKVHSKSHEGEKCYHCDMCSYSATTQRSLESHMLTHTDKKPFQCSICGQKFRQKQLLRRHINLYHDPEYQAPPPGEKPHSCPQCNKLFRHKGNLNRHMALHDPTASKEKLDEARRASYADKRGRPAIDDQDVYEDEDLQSDDDMSDNFSFMDGVVEEPLLENSTAGSGGQQVVLIDVSNAEAAAEAAHVVSHEEMELTDLGGFQAVTAKLKSEAREFHSPIPSSGLPDGEVMKKEIDTCFGFDDF